MYTVLQILLLADKVAWSDPVTKFVPELAHVVPAQVNMRSPITTNQWENITIGALASQLSGIARDFPSDLAAVSFFPAAELGFPTLKPSNIPTCGANSSDVPCTEQDFFNQFAKRYPVFLPYTSPSYSNIAYGILGLVIEAVTGSTTSQALQNLIVTPLSLTGTSLYAPTAERGAIPPGDSWWGVSLGIEDPAGGMYASTHDLLSIGRAILNSSLLDPTVTRSWLRPHTHTSSLGFSVGAPWEILRADTLTSDGRVIDFYTKNGGLGDYASEIVLMPEYGLVLTILVAGDAANVGNTLLNRLMKGIVPAVDQASKDEAASIYRFLQHYGNPGLKVTNWTRNGRDIFQDYALLESGMGAYDVSGRIYPTNLVAGRATAWRLVLYVDPVPMGANTAPPFEAEEFFIQGSCQTWGGLDGYVYGTKGVDEFVITLDSSGWKAVSVQSYALRATMKRS